MSRAARAQPYFWALQEAGVDVERRLALARLPSRLLYEPDLVMSSRAVFAFIDQISRKEGIENIALLGAELDGVRNLEPWVKNYLLGATTLKQLLERYCRLAKHYIPYRHYTLELSEDSARICSTADSSVSGEDFLRLSDWSNLLLLLGVLRRVLGQSFKPTAMTFQTKAALTPVEREKLQGIDVYQGWTTASVVLPKALLATPVPDALRVHPSGALPESMTGPPDFPAQVRKLLKPCLSEDWLDVSAAAEMAGCRARTLQRRLSAADLSFSELLDQARMEVAKTLLEQQDCRLIDIAMEVGYSDPAHFSRAFRRVNGVTPSQYRRSVTADVPELWRA
jgi:AraC-like DNA-binding protein